MQDGLTRSVSSKWRIPMALLTVIATAACAAMPEKELGEARAAVDAARAFQPYAPEAFEKADQAFQVALAEIEKQKGRTFHSYARSRKRLTEAVQASINARTAGELRFRALTERLCEAPIGADLMNYLSSPFLPSLLLAFNRAIAIDMARELRKIQDEYKGGYFGESYKAHAKAIESLAKRESEARVSSEELSSAKAVQMALYVDAILGLQAVRKASQSKTFAMVYEAEQSLLENLIKQMPTRPEMILGERRAVCEVIGAYNAK